MKIKLLAKLTGLFLFFGMIIPIAIPETPLKDADSDISPISSLHLTNANKNDQDTVKALADFEKSLTGNEESILGKDFAKEVKAKESQFEKVLNGKKTGDNNIDRGFSTAEELSQSAKEINTGYQVKKVRELLEGASPKKYEALTKELVELEKNLYDNNESELMPKEEKGQYNFDGKVYILVSISMGEKDLKEIIRNTRGVKNIVLVFRGYLPNESITEGNRRLSRLLNEDQNELLKELDTNKELSSEEQVRYNKLKELAVQGLLPPPSIIIDPAVFSDFSITHVPTMLYFVPGHVASTCKTAIRMDSPIEVCYLSKATGISNPYFLVERAKKEKYGDLGNFGNVVPVLEPDLREVMKKKVIGIDWKTKQEIAQKNFFRKRNEYGLNIVLDNAVYNKVRLIDPSISLEHNLTDSSGKVLLKAGTRVNPLDFEHLSKNIVIFNPNRRAELKIVSEWLATHNLTTNSPNVIFIATNIATSDENNGWGDYTELVHSLHNHVFLLKEDFKKTFNLRVTPTIITEDQERKLIRLEELTDNFNVNKTSDEQVEIETRGDFLTIKQVISGSNKKHYDRKK